MKLPNLMPTGQFRTWLEHSGISVTIPLGLGAVFALLGGDGLWTAAIASTTTLAVFLARELRDVIRHRADFDAPGNRDGVTWRADMWGDLNGPITAWMAYWAAFVVSLLS